MKLCWLYGNTGLESCERQTVSETTSADPGVQRYVIVTNPRHLVPVAHYTWLSWEACL